jgi:hypothetical protein
MISPIRRIIFARSRVKHSLIMSVVPPLSGTPLYRYIPGVGRVAAVQCGTSVTPLYGSFLSSTTQSVTVTNPVAITLSERTLGSIDVLGGTYPESRVVIPTTGTYRCMFSAQCDSSSGTHYLEIFPVVNGISVPDSNTRIRVSAAVESCLTAEYFLSFTAGDRFQLYMVGDNTNARILAITRGTGTPTIPDIPSIILTIQRIA